MDSNTQSKTEQYQPFTSPQFKSAKCFAGKTVLIHSDAQKTINKLPSDVKNQLNNQISCIATTNVSSVGRPKLYIETMNGLLEFVVSRKANRTETLIEQVRYLKGLRKPWTGRRISLPLQWSMTKNSYTYNKLYYSNPIYSYPEETLNRFLLRVAPEFHRLTNEEISAGKGEKVKTSSEYVSAIHIAKGQVKQYALIIETQGLPLLSVATRPAPQGFSTKYNMVNGARKKETIHTHGEKRWRGKVPDDTEDFIKVFANDQKHESELMATYHTPFEQSASRIPLKAKGDSNHFSSQDFKAYGWLVTEDRTLLFQKADKNTVTKKGSF